MWFENISIGRPIREDTTALRARDPDVFPRRCRGGSNTSQGAYVGNSCLDIRGYRRHLSPDFHGTFPVMVASENVIYLDSPKMNLSLGAKS